MRIFIFVLFLFLITPTWAVTESQIVKLTEKAPEAKSNEDLPELVQRLTTGLKKDEDKAYSLLMWIAKNIDHDDYKQRQIEDRANNRWSRAEIPESGDIMKTRLGVCGDIADLYKRMLEKADMKAVVITGCANGEVDRRKKNCKSGSGHAWNAVWIDKQWEFVDPTWAIGGKETRAMESVTKKRKYEKELKNREKKSAHNYETRTGRSVDRKWFMTSPQVMAQDHQPDDEKWLLLKRKDRQNKDL